MIEKEEKIDRRQVRCFGEDADWIEEEVRRREKVQGRRKVWPADVVSEAIGLLKNKHEGSTTAAPELSAKEFGQVEQFRAFLQAAPKEDVHIVLSLIARFSGDSKNISSLERRRGSR